MQIDVEQKILNGIKSSYLRLVDRTCRAQENETHFSLIAPLMGCGTVSSHTNDAVVYSNKVEEQEIGYEGMISRMPELTIPFSCYYTKEGVTSTFGIIPRKVSFNNMSQTYFFRHFLLAEHRAAIREVVSSTPAATQDLKITEEKMLPLL